MMASHSGKMDEKKTAEEWISEGLNLDDPDKALRCYERAVECNASSSKAHLCQGAMHCQLDQNREGVQCFDKCLELNETDTEALNKKAAALVKLSQTENALACAEESAKANDQQHEPFFWKGVALLQLGKYSDAVSAFEEALARRQNDPASTRGLDIARKRQNGEGTQEGEDWYLEHYRNQLHLKNIDRHPTGRRDEERNEASIEESKVEELYSSTGRNSAGQGTNSQGFEKDSKADSTDSHAASWHFNQGAKWGQKGYYEKAVEELDNCLAKNPHHHQAWNNKAGYLIKLENHSKALECAAEGIKRNPNEKRLYYWKGVALVNLKRFAEAVDAFEQALQIDRNYGPCMQGLGVARQGLKGAELKAFQQEGGTGNIFEDALQEARDDSIDLYVPQDYHSVSEGSPEGKTSSREPEQDGSRSSTWHFNQGTKWGQKGKLRKAVEELDNCLAKDPHHHQAWNNKAGYLVELTKNLDALQCAKEGIRRNPNEKRLHHWKGVALVNLRRFVEAIEAFEQGLRIDDSYNPSIRGLQVARKGVREVSLKSFQRQTGNVFEAALNETLPDIQKAEKAASKADDLYRKGSLEKASQAYERASRLEYDWFYPHYCRGMALLENGNPSRALECFKSAVERNRGHKGGLIGKATALQRLRKYEDAIVAYENFEEVSSDDPRSSIGKAYCSHYLRNFEKAVDHCQDALSKHPEENQEKECFRIKAKALGKLGYYDEAIKCCDAALAIDPQYSSAQEDRKTLLKELAHSQERATNSPAVSGDGGMPDASDSSLQESLQQLKQIAPYAGNIVLRNEVDEAIMDNDAKKSYRNEKKFIENERELKEYYRSFNAVLCDTFTAASVISSDKVDAKMGGAKSVITSAISSLGVVFPPASAISTLLKAPMKEHTKTQMKDLINVLPTRSDLNNVVEEVSRVVTIALSDSIRSIQPDMKLRARIWDFFQKIKLAAFSHQQPDTIFEAKGATDALAVVQHCLGGHINKEEFDTQHVLRLFFDDEDDLERIADNRQQIAEETSKFGAASSGEVQEQVSELQKQMQDLAEGQEELKQNYDSQKEEIRHVRSMVDEFIESQKGTLDRIEEWLEGKLTSQNDRIESHRQEIQQNDKTNSERVKDLHNTLQETLNSKSKEEQELRQEWESFRHQHEEQMHNFRKELESTLESGRDQDGSETSTRNGGHVASWGTSFVQTKVQDSLGAIMEKMNSLKEEVAEHTDRQSNSVNKLQQQLEEHKDTQKKKFSEKLEKIESRLKHNEGNLASLLEESKRKGAEETNPAQEIVSKQEKTIESIREEVETVKREQKEATTDLQQQMSDFRHSQQSELLEMRQQTGRIQSSQQQQVQRIEKNLQSQEEALQTLRNDLNNVKSTHQENLSQIQNELHQQLETQRSDLQHKLLEEAKRQKMNTASELRYIEQLTSSQSEKNEELRRSMNEKLNEYFATKDSLESSMSHQEDKISERVRQMFEGRLDELKEINERHGNFIEDNRKKVDSVQAEAADEIIKLRKELRYASGKNEAEIVKLRSAQDQAEAERVKETEIVENIDQQISKLEEAVLQQMSSYSKQLGGIQEKLDTQHWEQERRITHLREHVDATNSSHREERSKLRDELSEKTESQSDELQRIRQELESSLETTKKRVNELQQKSEDGQITQRKELGTIRNDFQSMLEAQKEHVLRLKESIDEQSRMMTQLQERLRGSSLPVGMERSAQSVQTLDCSSSNLGIVWQQVQATQQEIEKLEEKVQALSNHDSAAEADHPQESTSSVDHNSDEAKTVGEEESKCDTASVGVNEQEQKRKSALGAELDKFNSSSRGAASSQTSNSRHDAEDRKGGGKRALSNAGNNVVPASKQ
eukprot:gb/GECG01000917.1/.p1 GENE.gb/GECG01000917.1/~~gb/GECG01000917.1/.p1  ORF type:complete len:1849 (+),score=379.72 gb/GECG01000917.1/:1-5547(+)